MLVSFRTTSVNPGSQVRWLLLLGLVALPAACTQNYPEPVPSGKLDPLTEPAQDGSELEALLAKAAAPGADLNAILVEIERASDQFSAEPRYWKAFGGLSLAFAQEQQARGQVDALDVMFRDAEYAYGKALALSPEDFEARQGVVYSLRMLGDFELAWEFCQAALDAGWSGGNAAWQEELGRTGLALVIEAVQVDAPVPPAALPAEYALATAIELGSPTAAIALADLLAWQNRGPEGREVLVEALIRNPLDEAAVARLQNLTPSEAQVVAWERIRRAHPDTPVVLWRLGEALWNQSWLHRQNRNWAGAHDALDRAEALFLEAQAGEPSFASSCADWLHLVRTAHGWVYWSNNRVDDAADAFLSALEADPDHLEAEPVAESLRLGIYSVEGHYFEQNRVDKVRSFHSRLFRSYQDNPDWTNNYAFACREVGTALASQGELEQAKMAWKESWQAYTRTVELAPDDVRLVNDRALIAVYHLDDPAILALAEQELHRATQMGAEQQAQLAEDVPEQERRDLDEAVGDAWENLAYLDVMRRQRLDRAESFLVEAVKHYPFENRQGVVGLRAEMQRLRNENPESDQ